MKTLLLTIMLAAGAGTGVGTGVFEPAHHLHAAGNDEQRDGADQRHSGQFDQRGDERSDRIDAVRFSCAIQWAFNALTNAAPLGCTNYLTFGASSDGAVFTPTNTPFLTLTVVIPARATNGVLVTNLPGRCWAASATCSCRRWAAREPIRRPITAC